VAVEQHLNMRFAWEREQQGDTTAVEQGTLSRLIYVAYNILWWLPLVFTILGTIDYGTGFVAFLVITIIRAAANLYRNNFLTREQAERFPFRAP
jgi:hypothetical protein